jgi:heme/copper-type cytochrome/quinol oxidase subunit 1
MSKLIEKPHLIFLTVIPIIMMIGILSGDSTLYFNVHDTYLVILYFHLTILTSIFFGIIGFGYWIMQKANRKLSKWMCWTHIGLTFGGTWVILILAQLYRERIMEYEFNNNLTLIILLILLLIGIGQLLFPINIIYGLTKKRN